MPGNKALLLQWSKVSQRWKLCRLDGLRLVSASINNFRSKLTFFPYGNMIIPKTLAIFPSAR